MAKKKVKAELGIIDDVTEEIEQQLQEESSQFVDGAEITVDIMIAGAYTPFKHVEQVQAVVHRVDLDEYNVMLQFVEPEVTVHATGNYRFIIKNHPLLEMEVPNNYGMVGVNRLFLKV